MLNSESVPSSILLNAARCKLPSFLLCVTSSESIRTHFLGFYWYRWAKFYSPFVVYALSLEEGLHTCSFEVCLDLTGRRTGDIKVVFTSKSSWHPCARKLFRQDHCRVGSKTRPYYSHRREGVVSADKGIHCLRIFRFLWIISDHHRFALFHKHHPPFHVRDLRGREFCLYSSDALWDPILQLIFKCP